MTFKLFHTISFQKADPLGGGLSEEIQAERLEPEAITLEDGVVEGELETRWQEIEQDLKKDPSWFSDN